MVTVNTAPTVSNVQTDCDANNVFYTVSFTINGGDPSTYSVTPSNGTLVGNTFTSNQIFSSTGYSFVVSDANNCNPVTVSENIVVCDCVTDAGDMDLTEIEECGDGPITALHDDTDLFLEPNDILVYILHSGSGVNIVPPILGTFDSPTFSFDPGTMNYGQTYYLSAVAADSTGSGDVDMNDPCLDVSQGTPVTFYEIPSATLSGNDAVCAGSPASLLLPPRFV
jgi:hypothetical protein